MTAACPICNSEGRLIRNKVKGAVSVKVYRCDECYLDFLETWGDVI